MMHTDQQASFIARLKKGVNIQSLAVRTTDGSSVGSLAPITKPLAADDRIIADLCRWRAANRTSFLTVFEPSFASTRGYLLDVSIPDPARILFLILDKNYRRVGNIGLSNISEYDAELDNVIRGEQVKAKNFMQHVQWTLVDLAFLKLSLQRIYLNVLAENDRAIRSYERAGFTVKAQQPLERQETEDGYRLVPSIVGRDGTLIRMEIDKERLDDLRSRADVKAPEDREFASGSNNKKLEGGL